MKKMRANMYIINPLFLMLLTVSQAKVLIQICSYGHYSIEGQPCKACPKCSKGNGMNARCRSYPAYKSYEELPKCVPCIDGLTFSDHVSSEICYPCADQCKKIDSNFHETRMCTRLHNRLCECKRGYFKHPATGTCDQQCCYCDDHVGHQPMIIRKCKLDRMPNDKICAPTKDDGVCDERKIKTSTTFFTKYIATTESMVNTVISTGAEKHARSATRQLHLSTKTPTPSHAVKVNPTTEKIIVFSTSQLASIGTFGITVLAVVSVIASIALIFVGARYCRNRRRLSEVHVEEKSQMMLKWSIQNNVQFNT